MVIIKKVVINVFVGVPYLRKEYTQFSQISKEAGFKAIYDKIKEIFILDCESGAKSMLNIDGVHELGDFPICVEFSKFSTKDIYDICSTKESKLNFQKENLNIILEAILKEIPILWYRLDAEMKKDLI